MDLSQPVQLVLAFIAGFGFLLITRLIWSILRHTVQIALVAGLIFILSEQGYFKLDLNPLKNSSAVGSIKELYGLASSGYNRLNSLASKYELELKVASKENKPEKQSLSRRLQDEARPNYNEY
jgi:hypothetical protein